MSTEQRVKMLEFMKEHPALATNKFTMPDGVKHKARLLKQLASELNSMPNGATKSEERWLKVKLYSSLASTCVFCTNGNRL